MVPAGNPQAALLPAPLKGGDCLDGGRYVGRLVRWVVGDCGGAARGASCCAGDDLPEGMIWLRHELQLGLHELRCGALGVKPIAAPSESVVRIMYHRQE